uniref:NADH dehydrogenase subunit 4 n=1 Tax=Paralepas cf. quadrata TaxID=2977351 RepID=UPI0021CCD96F|nr:NADH dehydrogenase subunit 4 [Paralepas cf. quadrata]UWM12981.1 NADH dehydrogenase subunit 4 [Paralepas cf. quadrata]
MLKFLLLLGSLLLVVKELSLPLCCLYFSFLSFTWFLLNNLNYSSIMSFEIDGLSWFLILLTFWIILLMYLSSMNYFLEGFYSEKFSTVLIFMSLFLFITFSTSNFLMFYVFFEGSLIPIYVLIMGWGYQPERLQAGMYMLLYTIFASLPLLICIMKFSSETLSFSFLLLNDKNSTNIYGSLFMLVSSLAFLVKLPVFYLHLWLPKAHVEAPVSGSMMLAGVLLKLGCYGLMRFMGIFYSEMTFYLGSLLVSLGLLGGLAVSFICLRQVDMKSLIAYSSVSHMGLVLGGLASWGLWGYSGSLYMCVAHGLCSSGLFFLSGVVYERSGSRSLLINKGLLNIMPSISMWWFLFCVGNMGAPIVLNLIGELSLLGGILSYSFSSGIFLMIFSFMGACYSLLLFSGSQHGEFFSGIQSFFDGLVREHLILFLHFYPLFLLLLEVDFMTF